MAINLLLCMQTSELNISMDPFSPSFSPQTEVKREELQQEEEEALGEGGAVAEAETIGSVAGNTSISANSSIAEKADDGGYDMNEEELNQQGGAAVDLVKQEADEEEEEEEEAELNDQELLCRREQAFGCLNSNDTDGYKKIISSASPHKVATTLRVLLVRQVNTSRRTRATTKVDEGLICQSK